MNNWEDILHHIYLQPTFIQSNFARENAKVVCALASLGLISTKEGPQEFGKVWRVTPFGLEILKDFGKL